MTDSPYRVPLEQLDQERVARADQVVLHGDGTGPPPAGLSGLPPATATPPTATATTAGARRRARRGARP